MSFKLPSIFDNVPEKILPGKTIGKFPVNTFLENIVVDSQSNIFVTSYEEGLVYRLTLQGDYVTFASVSGKAAGIALKPDGSLLVAGVKDKISGVFHISNEGVVDTVITLPEAIFLNGMTYLTGNRYLIADSYKGAIWEVDIVKKTASVWLEDEKLARSIPDHPFPAVNGLKIYGNSLYASNTQRQELIKIPLLANYTPGIPEVFVTHVNLDDFAFDVEGNLYGTTHVYNSVVKIAPDGQLTTIAKVEQGMTGSTALAFGLEGDLRTKIYVTTNGGMSLPPDSGVASALVVELEVGVKGYKATGFI